MDKVSKAELINQKYREELEKLIGMRAAVSQQEDRVIDLHYQYVKAVNDLLNLSTCKFEQSSGIKTMEEGG